MVIRLDENYNAMTSTALLGYVGETNARPVSVEGLTVDGADRYVLTIDYGDGVTYEVDITGGQWTPTADILRSAQTISCQICAKKLSGDEYILVKKSRIFRLRIGAAIGDNAVPSPSVAADALDRIAAIGEQVEADVARAENAASTAMQAAENAKKSATNAGLSADTAEQAAERAETAQAAAETAAQTAQSIADSLPEDYVTAVEKIAENTVEIANVKLTDKELQRRVNALYSIGQGITHQFETDSETAYQKTVPTGAKLMSVKSVGGRSIVFNQLVDSNIVIGETTRYSFNGQHLTTNITDSLSLSDDLCTLPTIPVGHKVLLKIKFIAGNVGNKEVTIGGYHKTANISWQCKIDLPRNTELAGKTLIAMDTTTDTAESIRFFLYNATIPLLTNIDCYINYYDLTTMFGSGNEPVNVEEFEKMFPADYYPYNAGEIVSTGTESIVEQGANLYYGTDMLKVGSDDYEYIANSYRCKSIKLKPNTTYTLSFNSDKTSEIILLMNVTTVVNAGQYFDFRKASHTQTYTTGDDGCLYVGVYAGNGNVASADVVKRLSECKIMISEGDTPTAYALYHSNTHPIPEAIRNLPGYGWSAGTAKNYVDYENKRYVQCVGSVDLGTLSWRVGDSVSFETFQLKGQKLTKNYDIAPNILCSKYPTKTQNELWGKTNVTGITTNANVDGCVHLNDTTYTDAAAFQQAMQGVILYYELETPIVTDISSLIPDDFLRNLTVEAGGSVTFKGGNDDYRIPVPSEEEYIVKLSEVGGTT